MKTFFLVLSVLLLSSFKLFALEINCTNIGNDGIASMYNSYEFTATSDLGSINLKSDITDKFNSGIYILRYKDKDKNVIKTEKIIIK